MFFHNTPPKNRHTTNIIININEIKVNKSTARFIIGEASIKEIATLRDAFFLINILETKTTAQSHAGKKNPRNISINDPKTMFLEISFAIASLETYLSIIEGIKEPRSKKGRDNNYW